MIYHQQSGIKVQECFTFCSDNAVEEDYNLLSDKNQRIDFIETCRVARPKLADANNKSEHRYSHITERSHNKILQSGKYARNRRKKLFVTRSDRIVHGRLIESIEVTHC